MKRILISLATLVFLTIGICAYGQIHVFQRHYVGYCAGSAEVKSADIDGDGNIDIVSGERYTNRVSWFRNNGEQEFSRELVGYFGHPYGIDVVDYDRDGDIDVLAAGHHENSFTCFVNNREQGFTRHDIYNNRSPVDIQSVDIDLDGDIDILTAEQTPGNDIYLFVNNGAQQYSRITIDYNMFEINEVNYADVDGDGDVDVLGNAGGGDYLAWFENNGNLGFSKHSFGGGFDNPGSIDAADYNGDGILDLSSAAHYSHDISYWQRNNENNDLVKVRIDNNGNGAYDHFPIDFDDDGDIDVIASGTIVKWYENDGQGAFRRHDIDQYNATAVWVDDMDGDGDWDVIGSSSASNDIVWWEHSVEPEPIWSIIFEEHFEDGDYTNDPTWESLGHPNGIEMHEPGRNNSDYCIDLHNVEPVGWGIASTSFQAVDEFIVEFWVKYRPEFNTSEWCIWINDGEWDEQEGFLVYRGQHPNDVEVYHDRNLITRYDNLNYQPGNWYNARLAYGDGLWTFYWEGNQIIQVEDQFGEIENPYLTFRGQGWYNDGGVLIDDIVIYIPESPTPEIVHPDPIDFVDVELRRTVTQTVQVGNTGGVDLDIRSVSVTGDIYEIIDYPAIVESGSTGDITISFTPNEVADFPEIMTIESNDPDTPHEIPVTGTGVWVDQDELTERVIDDVEDMLDNGILNRGQGNSLISKLEKIISKIERGQVRPAVNQLNAFINQINEFIIEEIVPSEIGQPLIDEALFIIALLNDFGIDGQPESSLVKPVPTELFMSECYPNPFNSNTTISFGLPERSDLTIDIFDSFGRHVRSIGSGAYSAGYHSLIWNARKVPAGIYLIRMESGESRFIEKVTLIR